MSISNYAENKILDAVFSNTSFAVAAVYISLHTADPGETGASEVAGGTYARQLTAFDAAVAGATQNTGGETFTGMPAVTITHIGCWDALTNGNFLWGGALAASKVVNSGDTVQLATGALDITLD